MTLPELVEAHLDDERPVAEVALGGEDELYVTPTRTLVYRAEGLLSDETVETYPHDAERVEVAESRRKAKISLDYGLDGTETFAVPRKRLDDVLHPVLAGVLNAADITDAGETVTHTFRFSELTLVVTSERVVKHIGQAVWDGDFEEYHFDDVTDLTFEEGTVATSIVLTVGDRQERFKAPSDEARAVQEAIENALLDHYDVDSHEEFRSLAADAAPESESEDVDFGAGPDPLSAGSTGESGDEDGESVVASDTTGGEEGTAATDEGGVASQSFGGIDESGFEPATEKVDSVEDEGDLSTEVAELREAVERQGEELERQSDLIEQLIQELRQGR